MSEKILIKTDRIGDCSKKSRGGNRLGKMRHGKTETNRRKKNRSAGEGKVTGIVVKSGMMRVKIGKKTVEWSRGETDE